MLGVDAHLRLRDRVRSGEIIGPTLILAGPGLNGERIKTPEEGEREVRQQHASGFDLVKILPGLSLASYDAIVRTARELSMPFGGHVPPDVGVRHALQSGQETIEHLDGYLELLRGVRGRWLSQSNVERQLAVIRQNPDNYRPAQ